MTPPPVPPRRAPAVSDDIFKTQVPLPPEVNPAHFNETVAAPATAHVLAEDSWPETFGEYRIVRELGRGGFGVVFEGIDTHLDRKVAIKVLHRHIAADPQNCVRFLREARSVASLQHDNIITIHHFGEQDGLPYFVMELLPGMTLEKRLADGPRPTTDEANAIARQTAEALAAAHERSLIHRDVKPSNIWLETTKNGSFRRVRLLDFGLVRRTDSGASATSSTNSFAGTAAYASPEQAMSNDLDHRSDLFSLGIVLYEMIAGQRPFPQTNAMEVLMAIIRDPHPALSHYVPNVPPMLSGLVDRLLAKNPADRPKDAAEVARMLEGFFEAPVRPPLHEPRTSTQPTDNAVFAGRRLTRELGRGRTGKVYEADDEMNGRREAIKIISGRLVKDPNACTFFASWAQANQGCVHDNLMPILTHGRYRDEVPFLTMPRLRGYTLQQWLAQKKRLSVGTSLEVARQIALGLECVHARSMCHGNLKPANAWIEISPDNQFSRVRLMDTGLSYWGPDRDYVPSGWTSERGWTQADDLYSFGATLHQMTTGILPQETTSATSVTLAMFSVPPEIELLMVALLDENPANRPKSTTSVVQAIALAAAAAAAP